MRKMLIGIDNKSCALRAADYVGMQFGGGENIEVTLAHVLPNLPAIFWDEGHILSDEEKRERQKVVDAWLAKQKQSMESVLRSARDGLVRSRFQPGQVTTRFISDSTDVADSLLEAARDGGYQTIVVGRCSAPGGKGLLAGSVTNKLINKASGVAVLVVE